jgi:hypothetical protein
VFGEPFPSNGCLHYFIVLALSKNATMLFINILQYELNVDIFVVEASRRISIMNIGWRTDETEWRRIS